MIRKLIKNDLLEMFRHAEKRLGKGAGKNKLFIVTELVLAKYKFLRPFSRQVEKVVEAEFSRYKNQINNQIMTIARIV